MPKHSLRGAQRFKLPEILTGAVADYLQALEIDPGNRNARVNLRILGILHR